VARANVTENVTDRDTENVTDRNTENVTDRDEM